MGYLRCNYRLTGSHINDEVIRNPGPGAIFVSFVASKAYIFMSGASWLAISADAAVSI